MAGKTPVVLTGGEFQQLQAGDTLDLGAKKITSVADPTSAQDAATKTYADNLVTTSNGTTDAAAGGLGEFIEAVGLVVALTSNTNANLVSMSLPPGDWDVSGFASFIFGGTTNVTAFLLGVSTSSVAFQGSQLTRLTMPAHVPGSGTRDGFPVQARRILIDLTTTIYLVGLCVFTVSTCSGAGYLRARRMR